MKILSYNDKSTLEGHCKIWQSIYRILWVLAEISYCIKNFTVKSLQTKFSFITQQMYHCTASWITLWSFTVAADKKNIYYTALEILDCETNSTIFTSCITPPRHLAFWLFSKNDRELHYSNKINIALPVFWQGLLFCTL